MSAQECLEIARLALLAPTPDGMEAARTALAAAVSSAPPAAMARELSRVRALLEGAAEFYSGWARVLMANACGYTAGGGPATLSPSGTVAVQA